jgi:hypothetical protein
MDSPRFSRRHTLKSLLVGAAATAAPPGDAKPAGIDRRLRIRIKNDHHNVAGDFLSLRPAIYAAGAGEVRIRDVRYTAL